MPEYIIKEDVFPGTLMYDIVGELVRCRDCKFRNTIDCGMQFYGYDDDENLCLSDDWTEDDGFCYWGQRKDDV